jgi:hypothetical protein
MKFENVKLIHSQIDIQVEYNNGKNFENVFILNSNNNNICARFHLTLALLKKLWKLLMFAMSRMSVYFIRLSIKYHLVISPNIFYLK